MAKKKITQIEVSQEQVVQAQQVTEHYREIAKKVHTSKDRAEVEVALAEISSLSENAQIGLLKALPKKGDTDAADILAAVYEVSSLKNVRKEARRSLIRLEGAKVYPVWESPIERVSAITVGEMPEFELRDGPRRFWKGQVTDSRHMGQVQVLLCWEQGENFREILILGLLLDFTMDGAKDAFAQTMTGRSGFERMSKRVAESMPEVSTRDCTLGEGRRLLREALAVNARYGTKPGKDYRALQDVIEELILNAPDVDDGQEILDVASEVPFTVHGLEPGRVVSGFIELCFFGRHTIAYDLLAEKSRLREGLSKEDWVERRKDWLYQAGPKEFVPGFISEREPVKSKLWLPSGLAKKGTISSEKEIEAVWSVEIYETPLNHALPELPEASTVYEETQRRWYWASYTLIQEDGEWRILSMTDEVMKAQNLSVKDLKSKLEDLVTFTSKGVDTYIKGKNVEKSEEGLVNFLEEVSNVSIRSTYYTDALIKKTPLDLEPYESAALLMRHYGDYERSISYLSLLMERFPDQRAFTLWRIGEMQRLLSETMWEDGEDERALQFEELAEETLKEALALEDTFEAHISLIEIYMDKSDHVDDAEAHLLQAKALATEPEDKAHVERHLGEIAEAREQFRKALEHYQNVVDYSPDSGAGWRDLGDTQRKMELFDEAEISYKRAIELDPEDVNYYSSLSQMYVDRGEKQKAIGLLEDGLEVAPKSAGLHTLLSSVYVLMHDYREAELYLDKAESLDPDGEEELIPQLRLIIAEQKAKHPPVYKLEGPSKRKKRRR